MEKKAVQSSLIMRSSHLLERRRPEGLIGISASEFTLQFLLESHCPMLVQSWLTDVSRYSECVEIHPQLKIIGRHDFYWFKSVHEVIFPSQCNVKEIGGFREWISLPRIEIPSSVEAILAYGCLSCTNLREVFFLPNSHIIVISGFQDCKSLPQISIPPSIQEISIKGFRECIALREVLFEPKSHLRVIEQNKSRVMDLTVAHPSLK
jgi:hypothetical protein